MTHSGMRLANQPAEFHFGEMGSTVAGPRAVVRGDLPRWDGGHGSAPVRLVHSRVTLQACSWGGLGGRAALFVDNEPGSTGALGVGRTGPAPWTPEGELPEVTLLPRARVAAEGSYVTFPTNVGLGWDDVIAMEDGQRLRPSRHVSSAFKPDGSGSRHYHVFRGPFNAPPEYLTIPWAVAWERLPPVAFALREEDQGQHYQVPLPSGEGVLELRVGRVREQPRDRARSERHVFTLPWAYRLCGARAGALVGLTVKLEAFGQPHWHSAMQIAPDGVNGWSHTRSRIEPGGKVCIAVVAVGSPVGPLCLRVLPPGDARTAPLCPELTEWLRAVAVDCFADVGLADDGRWVLEAAEAIAGRRGIHGGAVFPEDVLLALLDVEPDLFREVGAEVATLWHATTGLAHGPWSGNGQLRLSDDSREVFTAAAAEARLLGANVVGPGHLLLGLLREGQSQAAACLMDAGLEVANLRTVLGRRTDP